MSEVSFSAAIVRPDANFTATADARRSQLESARREATASQVADAQASRERQSEQFRVSSEIISRAIGANTRLEISAGQGSNPFTYRAVDVDTGEIVSEWPSADFANLLVTLANAGSSSGLVVDEEV